MPWAEVQFNVPVSATGAGMSLEELNRMFYGAYPRRYFESALQLAASAYHDPAGALAPLAERTVVRGDAGEAGLAIQFRIDEQGADAIRTAAKLQMAGLYYHALETFVRLFLAHGPVVECPWMQLVRDEGPTFTQKAKAVEAFSAQWSDRQRPEDEHVRIAFLPLKDMSSEARLVLSNVKSWLRFAASECRDARAHHSFKHGVSVRSGAPQWAIYARDQDPRTNPAGSPFVEWSGEALVYLSSLKQPDKSRAWVMEHRKLQVVHRLSVIFLVQRLINTLLTVGELRYLDRKPTEDVYLPPVSFEEFVDKSILSSAPASTVTGFAIPVGWFDAPPPKRPGAGEHK